LSVRILILLHETDPYPDGPSYFAWGLRDVWREMGIEVQVARGLRELAPADLVLPHIDLTVTPRAYRKALDALPNVLNRGLYDISKRRVSGHLLARGDAWGGPVIVKTDHNYGGLPERRVRRRWWRRRRSLVRGIDYLLFDRLADVPNAVFRDRRLVVERFLPERAGDTYCLRWYIFMGDRYRSMRVASRHPLVKLCDLGQREFAVPLPPEVIAFREAWGMDFGKIDFVMHDGKPVILDVNRTPADLPPAERLAACRPYGPGVLSLLDPTSAPRAHIDVDG